VRVDSLAASAASVIAAEAAVCEMAPGAMMMIHKAWSLSIGNADDFRSTAGLLDTIDQQIAQTYQRRAGGDEADWLALMQAETWFTAEQAVAAKLADRLVEDNAQRGFRATWDLSAYRAAPVATLAAPEIDVGAPPVANPLNDADRRRMLLRIQGI
jgi:ATP-dependent Clp protease protease subunit